MPPCPINPKKINKCDNKGERRRLLGQVGVGERHRISMLQDLFILVGGAGLLLWRAAIKARTLYKSDISNLQRKHIFDPPANPV